MAFSGCCCLKWLFSLNLHTPNLNDWFTLLHLSLKDTSFLVSFFRQNDYAPLFKQFWLYFSSIGFWHFLLAFSFYFVFVSVSFICLRVTTSLHPFLVTSLRVLVGLWAQSLINLCLNCTPFPYNIPNVYWILDFLNGIIQLRSPWCGVHRTAQRHHCCHTDHLPAWSGEATPSWMWK